MDGCFSPTRGTFFSYLMVGFLIHFHVGSCQANNPLFLQRHVIKQVESVLQALKWEGVTDCCTNFVLLLVVLNAA